MRRAELLQEVRKMRFEEAYGAWRERCPTQEEARLPIGTSAGSRRARRAWPAPLPAAPQWNCACTKQVAASVPLCDSEVTFQIIVFKRVLPFCRW